MKSFSKCNKIPVHNDICELVIFFVYKFIKMWDNNSTLNQDEQLARLLIREAFIKTGFINDPNKEYHLEIIEKSKKKTQEIIEILNEFAISAKYIKRPKFYVVYIKGGEEISKFLAFVGASNSMLKFEDIRVLRETKNAINRKVNCETANLNKTINASVNQIENIKYLKKIRKFDKLPETLKEVANLRLDYPEATLAELGQMLEEPIGKSGVNHRLKRIEEIVNEAETELIYIDCLIGIPLFSGLFTFKLLFSILNIFRDENSLFNIEFKSSILLFCRKIYCKFLDFN